MAPWHHYGAMVVEENASEPIGTLEGFLGLHPLDLVPRLKPQNLQYFGRNVLTWSWTQSYNNEDLFKSMFEFSEASNIDGHNYPLYKFPDFIGRGYDPDPPEPAVKDTGISEMLFFFRSPSIFAPSYERQNKNVRFALDNWKGRVMPIVNEMKILIQWARKYHRDDV